MSNNNAQLAHEMTGELVSLEKFMKVLEKPDCHLVVARAPELNDNAELHGDFWIEKLKESITARKELLWERLNEISGNDEAPESSGGTGGGLNADDTEDF